MGERIALAVIVLAGGAAAQTTERVSVSTAGVEGDSHSYAGPVSADGRFVFFESHATNLVPADANGPIRDVFLRDRTAGTTTLVSVSSGGVQGNQRSYAISCTPDGRYAVFSSYSDNLVPGDLNLNWDVFLRDLALGTTELLSVSTGLVPGSGLSATNGSAVSDDGRYVVFESGSDQLVPGDTNNRWDVFLRDRVLGTTTLLSVSSLGVQGDDSSRYASISADGRFVAFSSEASNLSPVDTNGDEADIFVHDRVTGTTQLVSLDPFGQQQRKVGPRVSEVSADGRYVAFVSPWKASGSLPFVDPTLYLRDLQAGVTTVAAVTPAGVAPLGGVIPYGTALSRDARYVGFAAFIGSLGVYVRDRSLQRTTRVDLDSVSRVSAGGAGSGGRLTRSGDAMVFHSSAADLVPGDTNGFVDVFLHVNRPRPGKSIRFCTAATNSAGTAASIGRGGSLSLAKNDLKLTVRDAVPLSRGIFLMAGQRRLTPASNGQRCVFGGPLKRLPAVNLNAAGHAALPLNLNAFGPALAPGDDWNVQFVYRDAGASNYSDALSLTFAP